MNKDKVAIPGTGHKNRYADILPSKFSKWQIIIFNKFIFFVEKYDFNHNILRIR